jgi:hypothetical protein
MAEKDKNKNGKEAEDFNSLFDKELDDNFLSQEEGKEVSSPPEVPEIPYFPTISDIENLIDKKVPKVPHHFTIEVPSEIDEITPPEPLGDPPPPPVG